MREALFAILGPLAGRRVLDLYAGSGALGIEALSRGASTAVFVESARPAVACIHRNLERLDTGPEAMVVASKVERATKRVRELGPFDLVFCDPPWSESGRAGQAIAALLTGSAVADRGVTLVFEHAARDPLDELPGELGLPFDRRFYGDTALSLFDLPGALLGTR